MVQIHFNQHNYLSNLVVRVDLMSTYIIEHGGHNVTLSFKVKGQGHSTQALKSV